MFLWKDVSFILTLITSNTDSTKDSYGILLKFSSVTPTFINASKAPSFD